MTDLIESLIDKTIPEPNSGCWLWWPLGVSAEGYGHVRIGPRVHLAYRVLYELVRGRIPDGLELDHKCRTPACCNPDHLEPVTHAENVRRGRVGRHWASKTSCPAGHPYDDENTRWFWRNGQGPWRACRSCETLRKQGAKAINNRQHTRARRDLIYRMHTEGQTFAGIAAELGLSQTHCSAQFSKARRERTSA